MYIVRDVGHIHMIAIKKEFAPEAFYDIDLGLGPFFLQNLLLTTDDFLDLDQ